MTKKAIALSVLCVTAATACAAYLVSFRARPNEPAPYSQEETQAVWSQLEEAVWSPSAKAKDECAVAPLELSAKGAKP